MGPRSISRHELAAWHGSATEARGGQKAAKRGNRSAGNRTYEVPGRAAPPRGAPAQRSARKPLGMLPAAPGVRCCVCLCQTTQAPDTDHACAAAEAASRPDHSSKRKERCARRRPELRRHQVASSGCPQAASRARCGESATGHAESLCVPHRMLSFGRATQVSTPAAAPDMQICHPHRH